MIEHEKHLNQVMGGAHFVSYSIFDLIAFNAF